MTETERSNIEICENCGGTDFDLVFSGSDKLMGVEGQFSIVQCQNCGIYLLTPKISSEEMEKYYPDDYICYLEAIEDDPKPISRFTRKNALNKRCKQITKRVEKPGKILDVGCATGIFLDGMQQRGWDATGVEPNQEAAAYARQRFGLDVFNGFLDEAHFPDETFEVVTLWDVLEHVPDPNAFMAETHRILKPNGLVLGTLPNAKAWERYLFGEYWLGWEIPRHYRSHTPETIEAFLDRHGFADFELFSFIGRHGAFMISVDFWLNSWPAAEWKKKAIRTILGSRVVWALTYPYFLIAEKLNRSNVMTFAARKAKKPSNTP